MAAVPWSTSRPSPPASRKPYSGAYSVSKAGVKMLSQLLAVELGEHGIRSNVVSPGHDSARR